MPDHDAPLRVLLILAHPRPDSLCGALASAYREGAAKAGVTLRSLVLGELEFARDVCADSPENQPLEPDLAAARDDLVWADHLVFVYPTWWGTMPALLKSFLDRLVIPGLAFRFYGPGAAEWEGLWQGKSAQLITTMDTPPPIYRWLFKAPGHNAMARATLGFCGVRPTRILHFGPVRTSTPAKRARWLEKTRAAGFALRAGVHSPLGRAWQRAKPWLAALRLQFYPMSWAAYSLGAVAVSASLDWVLFLWGLIAIALLEAATVFSNERLDLATDRANANYGPFTGGSRVLVDGKIDPSRLRFATGLLLIGVLAVAALVLTLAPAPWVTALWMSIAAVTTLGYTAAPLKLSYRGLGELDVAFTHSALVVVLGGLLQGATLFEPVLWLVSAPLALAILPSIILAGVPDRPADESVGKRTLAVRFGHLSAFKLAAISVAAAAGLGLAFERMHVAGGAYEGVAGFVIAHATLALGLLWWYGHKPAQKLQRIDGLLVALLTYMLWFVLIPWINLA